MAVQIIIDTKEKDPLEFPKYGGIEVVYEALPYGDYTARHPNGELDECVIERKSIGDLFTSFSSRYDWERSKILRAQLDKRKFIIAIEKPIMEVRRGYYWTRGGQIYESKKSGLSMVKQLMTVSRKYNVEVWFHDSREEMAFRIVEFFKAKERVKK